MRKRRSSLQYVMHLTSERARSKHEAQELYYSFRLRRFLADAGMVNFLTTMPLS